MADSISSMPASHRSFSSRAKEKLNEFFDVTESIAKLVLMIFSILAMVFSVYYCVEIMEGLISIGIPVFPSIILTVVIYEIFHKNLLSYKH